MAKINNLKRLIKEDFEEEYHDLIDRIAYCYNPLVEQVVDAFNKNINTENLSREIITLTVENANGVLRIPTQFKTALRGRIVGMHVISAENLTNPAIYPTNAPFISWTINEKIITVKKITGIQDNNKYRLTIEVIS